MNLVYEIAFSPDATALYSGSLDCTARKWSLDETDTLKHEPATEIFSKVVPSPDGDSLASAAKDKTVILWDLEQRRPRTTITIAEDAFAKVAYSENGKHVFVLAGDQASIHDPQSGQQQFATL